jgi:hypothetical protein
MSTILKALRRLEEQKNEGAARPLRDEVVLAPTRRAGRSGMARAIVVGVVLAATATALLFAWRHEPAPDADVAAAPPTLPEVAAPPPAETTITVAAPTTPSTPTAVVPVPTAAPDFEIVRPDPGASARPLAPPPLPTIQDDEMEPEIVAGPERTGRPSVIRPMPEEYVEEPLEEAPEPRVAARASSPVRVARTLWHPSPDRRLAWVEVDGQTALREVREGERVGPYLVREIEPAAVLFSDGSVEVRREVGP